MARSGYYTNPAEKKLEIYKNFGGGLNTTTSNDNLANSELVELTNIDLGERGSLKRRYGMRRYLTSSIPQVRKGQGFFRYYRTDNQIDEIIATNGRLYIRRPFNADPTEAPTLSQTSNTNSTLSGGTYLVRYSWVTKSGETLPSPEAQFTLDASMELNVTVPTFPKDVIKVYVYIGTLDIAPTRQGETTTTSFTQSTGLVSGEALPTENHTEDVVNLPITNLDSFQVDKQIDAVQMEGSMFFTTGTKFVEYDGDTAFTVTPYRPQPLEALYIGTNGLANNPDNYLSDGTFTSLRIDGVTQDKRYGVVNSATTFTTYISKPDTMNVEYKYEYRKKGTETWTLGLDWNANNKSVSFTPRSTDDYELRFWVRDAATISNEVQYIMPTYKVKQTDENSVVDPSTMHNCTRMVLHWGRIIMYGDDTQPDVMYISHLKNPRYFPTVNSLRFENKEREKLTSLVQYRDMLVAFTPNTIQAVYGKSPMEFQRVLLHTGLGCVAPDSAQVMGNYITFLSKEGIHILKSVGYTESRVNVEKIDNQIDNKMTIQENACAYVLDSQYHICFPDENKRYRYYYEQGVWTKDESDKLDFARFFEWNGELYGQSNANGHVQKFDKTVWDDDGFVYQDIMETKHFDFGEPYHPKKLKELQLLMSHYNESVHIRVYVYADSALVINPDQSYASVDANGFVVWNVVNDPNVKLDAGTVLGQWTMGDSAFGSLESDVHILRLTGKCRRTKVKIVHEEAKPNQFLGLAYVFKTKKP